MKICVFHPRLGQTIGCALRSTFPEDEISIVENVDRDPPHLDDIEVLIANTFPKGLLSRCPRLVFLQLTGAGTDHLPSPDSVSTDLRIAHAGSVPARAVAEFAMMAVIGLAKQAPQLVRQQQTHTWQIPNARLLAGSTMVLLGLGNIGAEIAKRAKAFDMHVIAVTQRGLPSPLVDAVVSLEKLLEVARRADHLVIAVPATRFTTRCVNEAVICELPPYAVLVNVARASVLDMDALVRSLKEGRLRAACIDVHESEPLPSSHPHWDVEGLWVTPHCAFAYPNEANDLVRLISDNIRRVKESRNSEEVPKLENELFRPW